MISNGCLPRLLVLRPKLRMRRMCPLYDACCSATFAAAYQGQMVQFAFYVTTGFIDESIFSDVFVDNFYVREPPTCIEVSGVAVGSITGESATVSWTENGDATY